MKKLRSIVTVVALAATTYMYGDCASNQGAYQPYAQDNYGPQAGYAQGQNYDEAYASQQRGFIQGTQGYDARQGAQFQGPQGYDSREGSRFQGPQSYSQRPGVQSREYTSTRSYSSESKQGSSDDSTVENQIQNALQNTNVRVSVNNGTVTLKGTVNGDEERRNIEERVRRIPGVKDVDNKLSVSGGSRQQSQQYSSTRTDAYTTPAAYDSSTSGMKRGSSKYTRDPSTGMWTKGDSSSKDSSSGSSSRWGSGSEGYSGSTGSSYGSSSGSSSNRDSSSSNWFKPNSNDSSNSSSSSSNR